MLQIHHFVDSDYPSNYRRSTRGNIETTLVFADYSRINDLIYRGTNTGTILSPKETIRCIYDAIRKLRTNECATVAST